MVTILTEAPAEQATERQDLREQGTGCRAQGAGDMVQGTGCMVQGAGSSPLWGARKMKIWLQGSSSVTLIPAPQATLTSSTSHPRSVTSYQSLQMVLIVASKATLCIGECPPSAGARSQRPPRLRMMPSAAHPPPTPQACITLRAIARSTAQGTAKGIARGTAQGTARGIARCGARAQRALSHSGVAALTLIQRWTPRTWMGM
mmetsp:Transcript_56694/g.112581  ORF Transcript_56694/g.112581 Transcript_56694/m.112581 type:complete len:203 (-) Transcript_56694:45-653(-)